MGCTHAQPSTILSCLTEVLNHQCCIFSISIFVTQPTHILVNLLLLKLLDSSYMSVNWLVEDPMMATRTLQMKRRGNNWNYTNQSHFMTGLAKPRPQERY